ncbi:hypothetical protein DENSPDRAFT_803128 [Dentipellis sp. KUC8613]|nr:hypothetical protein DENSPDRAFT_803128 [Dentipellis sp. KUC8613]
MEAGLIVSLRLRLARRALVSRCSFLTKCVGVAAFTVLIWDHMISFADEVQYVWKGNKGPLVYLFFVNRYLIPLSFIINIYAYFSDSWTTQSCNRFVRYEGALTMIGIAVVALMMFLRIRALYHRQVWVQAFVFSIFLAFIGTNAWLLSYGEGVPHVSSNVRSCSMIFDHRAGSMAAASAWLPLLYDTVVLCLTLFRTIIPVWHRTSGQILRVILREGMMYYSVIFSVTLVLTIMILHAEPSVQNITAQLELLLTVTMMSRITIHLKRFAHYNSLGYAVTEPTPPPPVELSWNAVTHPPRARSILPGSRGRIQHVERRIDDSFFSMVTLPSSVDRASNRAVLSFGSRLDADAGSDIQTVDRSVCEGSSGMRNRSRSRAGTRSKREKEGDEEYQLQAMRPANGSVLDISKDAQDRARTHADDDDRV